MAHLQFSISPRILKHLGNDLIKDESIALFELVKNSYDACATKCEMFFQTNQHANIVDELTIKDNGLGMSLSVIENVWLTIGTDNKAKNIKETDCGRLPIGEKGIGRLSVHKLGNIIEMYTRTEDHKEVHVFIDWNQIDSIESIDEFIIRVEENDVPVIFKNDTGTFIKVRQLKGNWDSRGKLRDIYRTLLTFSTPFDSNESFTVDVSSNNPKLFDDLPKVEDILQMAMYKCEATISGSIVSKFNYEFAPWSTINDKIDGRNKDKLDEIDKNLYRKIDTRTKEIIDLDEYQIGNIKFKLYVFEKNTLLKNFYPFGIQNVNEYLKHNGGMRVFRDGIRVFNYGEQGNDWLGIDAKRVVRVGGNISNNIILGAVNLDRKTSRSLEEKTNREGFIENEAYEAFEKAIEYVLSIFVREINVDKQRIKIIFNSEKKSEPVVSDLNDLEDYIRVADDKEIAKETKTQLLNYVGRIKNSYDNIKDLLIKQAGLGLSLGVIVHETEKLIARSMKAIREKNYDDSLYYVQMLNKIVERSSYILKKSDIKNIELGKLVEKALDTVRFRFKDHKIRLIDEFSNSDLLGKLPETQTISMLLNLLDNAIFWTCISKEQDNRSITIKVTDEIDGYHSIVIADSGNEFNLPEEMLTTPFVSGKPLNAGTGLGLYLVDLFMKEIGGQLKFPEKGDIEFGNEAVGRDSIHALVALCFKKN